MLLKLLAFVFVISGFATVFLARKIVDRHKLAEKAVCNFEDELTEEELLQYKLNKAILSVKMMGMLIALPGLILVLVIFK